jgi:serine protease Do
LINLHGELIGINVAMLEGAQGIGFAIPIREVREALAEMFNPETASRWFGARVGVDLPLVVQFVETNSPAGRAGLKIGDTVLKVNGTPAGDFMSFNSLLRDESSSNFVLTVSRGAADREIRVPVLSFRQLFRDRLGADLRGLTSALVTQLGLGRLGGVESGLFVWKVEENGPAAEAALPQYCVVTAIEGQRVHNDLEAFLVLSKLEKGAMTDVSLLVPRTRGDVILGYQEEMATVKLR